MTTAALSNRLDLNSVADATLKTAIVCWVPRGRHGPVDLFYIGSFDGVSLRVALN